MLRPDARILGRVCTYVGDAAGIIGADAAVKPAGRGKARRRGRRAVEPARALPYRGAIMGLRLFPA